MSRTAGPRIGPLAATSALVLAGLLGCEARLLDVSGESAASTTDGPAGSAVLVAVVNPIVNTAHNTGTPKAHGDTREGIDIDPEPGAKAVTADGLAVVEIESGTLVLHVGPAQLVLDAPAAGDVLDAAIAFDGTTAALFAGSPLRSPVGEDGDAVFFDPDVPLAELEKALSKKGAIVVLRPGTYTGDLTIKGRDVLVFGEGWSEHAVVLDGSVTVDDNGVRLRGVTVTGDLTAKGNDFGLSFSRVYGTTRVTGAGGTLLRNTLCGTVVVAANNATLLDNVGLAPIAMPPAGACDSQGP